MFCVCGVALCETFLFSWPHPHALSPLCRAQTTRKRFLGSDVVLVIFQDGDTPYRPETIKSHFLHAVIVVQV